MLCQIILTAIAISCTFSREITVHARGQGSQRLVQIKDVICVLLLSGLQKEDLDTNTLAKLQRHNVNIYDMNNESLRQECLPKSYLQPEKDAKSYKLPKDLSETSKSSTNRLIEISTKLSFSDNLHVDKQDSNVVTPEIYSADQTNLRNLIDEKKNGQTKQNCNENLNTGDMTVRRPDNINISLVKENKSQQIEYIKDKPSLDSVMKFWAKLTNRDSGKTSTETTTTYSPSPIIETKETTATTKTNVANVQSKEIEYVSKMIAEYLRSQSTPTTTQASNSGTKDMDIVSRTIKEFLDKNTETDSKTVHKNVENTFGKDLKELGDLTDIGKLFEDNNKEEERTEKPLHMQQKDNNDDNIDKAKSSEVTLFSSLIKATPEISVSKSERKIQALKYISNMLTVNDKFKLNSPISTLELSKQDTTINNRDYERLMEQGTKHASYSNSFISMVPNTNLVKDNDGSVSADFIKEIAEKVKEIVMRDIRKEITTTERVTSCLTTKISASTPAIPTTFLKDAIQPSVIQTLMELLREMNTIKEVSTTTTDMPMVETLNNEKYKVRNLPLDVMYPPVLGGLNPYIAKTPVSNIKVFEANPYNPNLVPILYGMHLHPPLNRPTYMPQTNIDPKSEYKAPPLTIQTNSAEIAPLVIQVSKPMKVMNQHIIVTTQNPFEKQRDEKLHRENKQRLNFNYAEPFHVPNDRNQHVENPTFVDLTNKLRIAENVKKEFRESYKDKIEKIKERIERNRNKATELRNPIESERGNGYSSLEQSKHHVSPNLELKHHGDPKDTSNRHDPRYVDPNRQEHFIRPVNAHHRQTFDQAANINNHENLNRPADSSYRDIITREFLSSLTDSNRHDVINQLVEPNTDARNPIDLDHRGRSHRADAYERFEHERSRPRYKATKFHEKLEQIENVPQKNYESYSRSTTQSSYDPVASRQQLPLNKVKEHPRFDDSHFRNFLKSQQKVTDMLERILAAKSKSTKESS